MTSAREIAARLFRATLWNPEGTPVHAAEIRADGTLIIVTGPEKHTLGVPRRVRKVFPIRTYRPDPTRLDLDGGEVWACNGFGWKPTLAAALDSFHETLATVATVVAISQAFLDQVRQSLAVYRDRGEFDGTLDSAKACLLQAGYELDPEIVRAAKQCCDEVLS